MKDEKNTTNNKIEVNANKTNTVINDLDENDIQEKNITQSIKQDYANENVNKTNINNANFINSNANLKNEENRFNNNNNNQKELKNNLSNNNNNNNNNLNNNSSPNNDYKNLSTRAYLEMTVVPIVMSGMTELAKEKPDNPLEWLGQYILKHAHSKK